MVSYRTNIEGQSFFTKYITLLSMGSSLTALPNIEIVTSKASNCLRVTYRLLFVHIFGGTIEKVHLCVS